MVKNEKPAGMLMGKFIFERMHMEVEGWKWINLKPPCCISAGKSSCTPTKAYTTQMHRGGAEGMTLSTVTLCHHISRPSIARNGFCKGQQPPNMAHTLTEVICPLHDFLWSNSQALSLSYCYLIIYHVLRLWFIHASWNRKYNLCNLCAFHFSRNQNAQKHIKCWLKGMILELFAMGLNSASAILLV